MPNQHTPWRRSFGPYRRRGEVQAEFAGKNNWESFMCEPEPCIGCGKMVRWHKPIPIGGGDKFFCFEYPRCENRSK